MNLLSKKLVMISLPHLNKYITSVVFFTLLIFSYALAEDEPTNIWETDENKNEENDGINNENETEIKNLNFVPSLSLI